MGLQMRFDWGSAMTKLNIAMLLGALLGLAAAAPVSANALKREVALDAQPTTRMQLTSDQEPAIVATEADATVDSPPTGAPGQGRLSQSSATPTAAKRVASLPSNGAVRHGSGRRLRGAPLMLGIGY